MDYSTFLTTYKYSDKRRLGNRGDGGYVIADLSGSYDCYISAGVNDEESFSRDFIPFAHIDTADSYAFDGTIPSYPYQYTTDIHFVRKNIADFNSATTTNLQYLIRRYNNIFLKMDIEGGEYPWLYSLTLDDLQHFKQIVIEIHCPADDTFGSIASVKYECLKKLATTHRLVHVHPNNNGTGWGQNTVNNGIPTIMELTYIRNDTVTGDLPLNTSPFPVDGLDYNNAPYGTMYLTAPPFCFRE